MSGTFKVAPMSMTAWVYTIVFLLALLFFVGRTVLGFSNGEPVAFFDVGASILLVVMVIYGWMRSIKAYTVEPSNVVIQRAGPGRLHIPVEDIGRVEARADLGSFFNSSFLGTGGLFGWAGRVKVRKPTDVRSLDAEAFGTNPDNSVMIQLKDGRTLIVTPADPSGFVEALRSVWVESVGAGTAPARPGPRSAGPGKKKKR